MAIGIHRVQPIKSEDAASGGDSGDVGPYGGPLPVEAQEDALECAGTYYQDALNRDEEVYVYREGGDLKFRDLANPLGLTLTQTAAGGGGGTSDHGLLIGLGDDDHTQYQLRSEEALAGGYAPLDGSADLPLVHLPAHSITHEASGVDTVVAQNLGSDTALSDMFMTTVGDGSWQLKVAPQEAFGTQLTLVEDDTESTTSSSTFQQKSRLTTPDLPTGNYMLLYKAVVSGSANGTKGEVQIEQNDTAQIDLLTLISGSASGQQSFSGFKVFLGLSGVNTFDIDYRKTGGSGSIAISRTRLIFFRIS